MNKIRFFIALWVSKAAKLVLKLTGFNATNFPGIVALKLCPNFLQYIAKPEKIIAVTGTNGKTTVTNLVIDMLKADDQRVNNNSLGSNTVTGIATSLIDAATLAGKSKYSCGVYEVDERSAVRVYPYMTPDYLVVTNLSRDSIMRNGHPEFISNVLTKYIPEKTKLILNADDLISANLAPNNERKYFGIEKMDTDVNVCTNLINDMQICPKCQNLLKYEYLRYHHIGKAYCPSCGFASPEYDYKAYNINTKDMSFTLEHDGRICELSLLNDSVFNIYNVLCTSALFCEMGYTDEHLSELLKKVKIVESRFNTEKIGDKSVTMQMAKDRNAFACSRAFDYVAGLPGDKEIIMMMNNLSDAKDWSENTCWLYDCDFELLNKESIKHIIATGPRGKDYYLRLLLAGIDKSRLSWTKNEIDAPDLMRLYDNDNIYILFGTDSIKLAQSVSEKAKAIIRGKMK